MPAFTSKRSIRVLREIHPDLQAVCIEAIKHIDYSLIDGIRTLEQQQALFNAKRPTTTLDGITRRSKHQGVDGQAWAFDFIPAPFTFWSDRPLFTAYAHFMIGIGKAKGIDLTWGGDWDNDFRWNDQQFHDFPHIMLTRAMP